MTTPTPPRVRIYVPGSHQLTLRLNQGGQEAAVVLGYLTTSGFVLNQASAIDLRDKAWNAFRPLISNTVTCTGALLRNTSAPEGEVVEVGAPTANAGTQTGIQTLAAGATLIRWTTTKGGRSGRGRTFLPGLTNESTANGGRGYATAFATQAATAVTTYLNAFGSGGTVTVAPAVLSFTKGTGAPITGGSLASVVGVQRRRMR